MPVKEVEFHYKYRVTLLKIINKSSCLLQFTCYDHFDFCIEDRKRGARHEWTQGDELGKESCDLDSAGGDRYENTLM